MKRFEKFSPTVTKAFLLTLDIAHEKGRSSFYCFDSQFGYLMCGDCPFGTNCKQNGGLKIRTVDEWLDWALEEVEE